MWRGVARVWGCGLRSVWAVTVTMAVVVHRGGWWGSGGDRVSCVGGDWGEVPFDCGEARLCARAVDWRRRTDWRQRITDELFDRRQQRFNGACLALATAPPGGPPASTAHAAQPLCHMLDCGRCVVRG